MTSARTGLSDEDLADQPHAGAIFLSSRCAWPAGDAVRRLSQTRLPPAEFDINMISYLMGGMS